MISVISDKRQLENGDCSLPSSPPKYKIRKVSAVRDFPCGCGQHTALTNLDTEEVEGGSLKMLVDFSKDFRYEGQKRDVFHDVEKKGFFGERVESQSQDFTAVCSEGKARPCLVKYENREGKSAELGGPPVTFKSDCKFDESVYKNPKAAPILNEKMEESMLIYEVHDKSKDIGVVDYEDSRNGGKSKIIEGSILQLPLLPYHPIPSCLERKEKKFPARKSVSAVRDFPSGCGCNSQQLIEAKDELLGCEDANAHTHQVVARHDEHQTSIYSVAEAASKNGVNNKAKHEGQSDESSCGVISMLSSQYNNCSETMVQKQAAEAMNNEQCEGSIEKAFYKAEHEKERPTAVSCSNISQEKCMADLQSKEGRVIIQCLMAETNCPWKRGKEAVKSSLSSSNAKRYKGKKQDYADIDKYKCSTNKSEVSSIHLRESSTALVPYLSETDMSEFSSISRRQGDSFEDEELSNDFPLAPRKCDFDISLVPLGAVSSGEKGVRRKVREALRRFHGIVRKLQQEEQTKSKDKANANKRIDLHAAKILKDQGKYVNSRRKSIQGSVPGVEVGDLFHFRIELLIVGLHRHLQSGIDYFNQGEKIIATSIVASGGYANDVDSSDVLIYTGQGGNANGDKEPEDQKLERGNLALKNSIDEKNGVRVIRGFKEKKLADTDDVRHKTIATYTYDGLYIVEKYWHDIGQHGKLVYKFQLRRLPGQPELAWKEVTRSKYHKVREGRCMDDISEARETVPICAINALDDERPPSFTYVTNMMYPDWCQPIPPKGCDCKDGCSDSESCACATKNGGEIPYNYDGAIVEAKSLVYECGPSCKCPSTCHNRVSQYGVKLPLEMFKTESRGWGVRCLSSIPSGSFICEYIGELLDDKDAERRSDNDEYLFDIGQNYNDPTWDGLSCVMPDVPTSSSDVENVNFTIDAAKYGNIGRFINHSCSPNLYAQNVLYDYDDKRIPHIMLFAAENIPPLQELTYHYNYAIDQVLDPDGNIKKKSCYCGSSECSGRMY